MKITNEIWKDIPNYEGLYQASSLGRIKSLDRYVVKYNALTKNNNIVHVEERILKPSINKYGYYAVSLNKKNKRYTFPIHRLIAETFLNNPNNLPQVNHIDENKLNNKINNLEFITLEDNVKYSLNKPIYKMNLNGEVLEEYPSINEAGRQNNICYQNIWKCCVGKRKTAGSFMWRFLNESN